MISVIYLLTYCLQCRYVVCQIYELTLVNIAVSLTTIGRHLFPVAAATVWNTLPVIVLSSPSIATFRQRLKTFLFQQSFLDIII